MRMKKKKKNDNIKWISQKLGKTVAELIIIYYVPGPGI
jgi:hypothetical protein